MLPVAAYKRSSAKPPEIVKTTDIIAITVAVVPPGGIGVVDADIGVTVGVLVGVAVGFAATVGDGICVGVAVGK